MTLSSLAAYPLKYYFGDEERFIPSSLKKITFAEGSSTIDKALTQGYLSRVELVLANDTTKIDEGQFMNASSLGGIVILNSVETIGSNAFKGASILTGVIIPKGVTTIGDMAFDTNSPIQIFVEAKEKPAGWHENWTRSDNQIVWGYTN